MKLVQCPNKHYYDADKYSDCPICHPEVTKGSQASVPKDYPNEEATMPLYEEKTKASEKKEVKPEFTMPHDHEKEETKPLEKPVTHEESLADMIKNASATLTIDEDDDKTVPFYAKKDDTGANGRGYVVGWLVGVKGAPMGKSFEI